METYAEDDAGAGPMPNNPPRPDCITPVAVYKMTQHDAHALMPAIADVSRRQWCPTGLLGDSPYGSTEHVARLQTEGLTLLVPAMPPKGAKPGQLTLEDVTLDEVGRVVAYPQGHAPVWTSVSETKLAVRFDLVSCQECPYTDQCPGASAPQAKSETRWQYTHERVAPCQRRLAEQLPSCKDRYRWRAGIAATMSRLKQHMHLARLRVRGMVAIQYTVFRRALGLNVLRGAACV